MLGSSPAQLPALLSDAAHASPVVLALAAVAYVPRPIVAWHRAGRVTRRVLGAGVPVVLLVAGVGGPAMAAPKTPTPTPTATATPAAPANTGTGVCPTGARTITYDLAAIPLDIPLNGWGDHLPNGMVYALANADARVGVAQLKADPQLSQPVVIRAAVGDCIKIQLRNDLSGYRVGIHPDGLVQFDPMDSDGARVGNNPDTTLATGERRTYTWYADHEGEAPVVDVANLDDTTDDGTTVQHGLFGAVIVHPKGSTWHDQVTGADMLDPSGRALETDVAADVHVPGGTSFRSFAAVIMDEIEGVRDRTGQEPTFPTTGQPDSTFGINYRSEPLRNRLRAILDHRAGRHHHAARREDVPAHRPLLRRLRARAGRGGRRPRRQVHERGEPPAVVGLRRRGQAHPPRRLGPDRRRHRRGDRQGLPRRPAPLLADPPGCARDAPVAPAHPALVHRPEQHQVTAQGRAEPRPGRGVRAGHRGRRRRSAVRVGDSIFHCHLYPHFAQGFWGHERIFDRLRDGTQSYPDGTPLQALQPLPDRAGAVPAADALHPGFPLFVKGDVGQRAYRIPLPW